MAAFIKKLVPATWLPQEPAPVEEATESTWEDWDDSVAFQESQMHAQCTSSNASPPPSDPYAWVQKSST